MSCCLYTLYQSFSALYTLQESCEAWLQSINPWLTSPSPLSAQPRDLWGRASNLTAVHFYQCVPLKAASLWRPPPPPPHQCETLASVKASIPIKKVLNMSDHSMWQYPIMFSGQGVCFYLFYFFYCISFLSISVLMSERSSHAVSKLARSAVVEVFVYVIYLIITHTFPTHLIFPSLLPDLLLPCGGRPRNGGMLVLRGERIGRESCGLPWGFLMPPCQRNSVAV